MKEHPMVTGVYGSTLLDRVIDHETKPYVYEGKKQGGPMSRVSTS